MVTKSKKGGGGGITQYSDVTPSIFIPVDLLNSVPASCVTSLLMKSAKLHALRTYVPT